MPRNYKPDPRGRHYRKYDTDIIKQALEEYNITPRCSLAYIADKYKINKSVLYRHNRRTMKKQGGQNALDEDTERYIVQYLNILSSWGYSLDTYDLRIIVKSYLDNLGITHKRFKNNMPGPDYATRFLKRYKDTISLRMCQNIKKSRAQVCVDEYTVVNDLQDKDERFIANYLPNIEPETIFSEFIDVLKEETCDRNNTKNIETKEEKSKKKMIEIISVQKVANDTHGVNLRKCKEIPLNTIIDIKKEKRSDKSKPDTIRRPSYYKNDADILRDLIDDNF